MGTNLLSVLTKKTPSRRIMAVSRIRQNFHEDNEALINKQINMEFYASYVYLSMSSWFNRDEQALHGFAAYFKKQSDEERDHGMKLMEYQAKRGGKCVFLDIAKPEKMEWGTPLEAMKAADGHNDAHLCDFLEANYLDEQVEGIKEIADKITQIERAGPGLGLHMMDKEMA